MVQGWNPALLHWQILYHWERCLPRETSGKPCFPNAYVQFLRALLFTYFIRLENMPKALKKNMNGYEENSIQLSKKIDDFAPGGCL